MKNFNLLKFQKPSLRAPFCSIEHFEKRHGGSHDPSERSKQEMVRNRNRVIALIPQPVAIVWAENNCSTISMSLSGLSRI
jgi:hypothetical protein